MKRILMLVLLGMLLVVPVVAQEETTTLEVLEAGVTPDSPLYGLDRAIERIQLSLTFDRSAKAKMGLRFAAERLEEVKQMIEEKKVGAAETAKIEYDNIIEEVEENIDKMDTTDSIEDIETRLIDLKNKANEAKNQIFIKIKGTLNPEEELLVQDLIDGLKNRAEEAAVQVKNKKDMTMIRIKEQIDKPLTEEDIKEGINETEPIGSGDESPGETGGGEISDSGSEGSGSYGGAPETGGILIK